jgi:peptide/nickel transport system permease protein
VITSDLLILTVVVSLACVLFVWVVSFPIAVYSATHQYGFFDYVFTFLGYIGLATPSFLIALILLYFSNIWFGTSIGGLIDPVYLGQPWSWAKFGSLMAHMWVPILVIGLPGTAGMIRRLRANLLDELNKQYVTTGRAKGLPPFRLLVKYPLRISLNPFIADIGSLLPELISGSVIVAIVMSLPITGPILLKALRSQDMYLAGSFLMFISFLTVVGVFISDVALALLDPRIRFGAGSGK